MILEVALFFVVVFIINPLNIEQFNQVKMISGCGLNGVLKGPGRCLQGVWKVSRRCLESE